MKTIRTGNVIAIFFALLFSSTIVLANDTEITGTITGKITTADHKPASQVTVTLKGTNKNTLSDDDGNFVFKRIAPGNYEIVISLEGYETIHQSVTVTKQTVSLSIQLKVSVKELEEVTVVSAKGQNQKTISVGKSGIAARDFPQSIVTIEGQVLERQQALTLTDILMNVNGVYIMGQTGGTQHEVAARGFAFNNTNTFKNGMRFNNSVMPEVSSLDKFEVIKGSAAILYGNVTAGGMLNLVTKKPSFNKGGEMSMRMGSYDFYKPSIDIYGPLADSKDVAYRLVSSYEKSRSYRDNVNAERFYINPSFLIKAGKKITVLVEGDYVNDSRTIDFGIGAVNYTIPNLPRNVFIGTPWSNNKAQEASITVTTNYRLNENWQLKNISGFYNYTNNLLGVTRPDDGGGQAIQANGNWVRGVQHSGTNEDYYMTELDLTGKFNTGKIKHQLLFGIDADKYETNTLNYNILPVYDSINIFDLNKYKQRSDIPALTLNTSTHTPLSRMGTYVQDLISLTSNLKVLAGIRYSYQQTISDVLANATSLHTVTTTFAHPFTPRVGIVYQPSKNISTFVSYANSFTLNTGIDTSGKALPPSYINQYEAGIKTDWFNKLLSLNITAYKIVNSNLAQTSLANGNTNSNIKELAGEVTSKGVEADLVMRSINGLTAMAGYSYNDSRYTKSNVFIIGNRLQYNPQHTANASLYYTFSNGAVRGLNLGLMASYVGVRQAGREPRAGVVNDVRQLIPLPAFTQVDASAGYSLQKISFRLKISNVFNALSYYAHEDGSVNPIAPRSVAATVSCRLF